MCNDNKIVAPLLNIDAKGSIKPYSAVGSMIIGSFMQNGALVYNEQDGVWNINFDKVSAVAGKMFRKILLIQATGNRVEGEQMIHDYAKDQGLLELIRYEDIQQRAKQAAIKPSTIHYQVLVDEG